MDIFLKVYVPVYMAVFFLAAMLLPSWLLYRRTGVNPVTFGKGAESAHDYIGLVFKLIFSVVTVYVICNSFTGFGKLAFMDTPVLSTAGIVLSLLSLAFILAAQRTMADSWRIGIDEKVKTELVTTGIFSRVRNPIFSGMLLVLASLFLLIPTSFTAFVAILSYILINIQVRLEEEFLARVHGERYLEYKKRAGRFLPRLLRR